MDSAPSSRSSSANTAPRPRGQEATKFIGARGAELIWPRCARSKWLDHHQDHDSDQDDSRNFVQPAKKPVSMPFLVLAKIPHDLAKIPVINDEQGHQRELGIEPPSAESIIQPKP